jgi:hypothetical protein
MDIVAYPLAMSDRGATTDDALGWNRPAEVSVGEFVVGVRTEGTVLTTGTRVETRQRGGRPA